MALRDRTVLLVQMAVMFWTASWFPGFGSSAYELQDTIHALKEENIHLHHRLENLTRALRELKHLLDRSRGRLAEWTDRQTDRQTDRHRQTHRYISQTDRYIDTLARQTDT